MTKLKFLCVNHRRWLRDNPDAAVNTCVRSFSRGLDLAEEHNYREAINYAGAAFESSDIVLAQAPATWTAIRNFADSGALLVRLLNCEGQGHQARNVLGAATARLEALLTTGVERQAVMAGCRRLLHYAGEEPSSIPAATLRPAYTPGSVSIH